MNPTKCPNCRLSLPQNWSGSNDPNAKCPYCGKPVAGSAAASSPAVPVQPAPAPKTAAKTILWGVGAPLPGRAAAPSAPVPPPSPQPIRQPTQPIRQPSSQPIRQPSPSSVPFAANEALAEAPTLDRKAVSEPAPAMKSGPVAPVARAGDAGDFDVDVTEAPAPEQANVVPTTSNKPNQPAPTVMFESAVHGDASLSKLEQFDPASDAAVKSEPSEEPEPSEERSPRPTPTRVKGKAKPLPRKVYKPKSGFASKRGEDVEDLDMPQKSSSKAGIIVFLVLLLCGAVVVGIVLMRGKGKGEGQEERAATAGPVIEPAPAQAEPAPSEKPAALAPKPAPAEPFKPAAAEKPAPTERPTRAAPAAGEKPTHAPKAAAEKPTPVEKPTRAEKAKPESASAQPESKPAGGKATEDDYRRANEAYQRGNAKLFAGNAAEAIAEFNQALKLNPKDPAIHRGLGLAYEKAGKSAEAIKHLKLYLKASPKANDRAIIEKRIDQLRGQ